MPQAMPNQIKSLAARLLHSPHPELFLDAVLQNLSDGAVLILDKSGWITWANDQAPRVLGQDPSDFLGHSFFQAVPLSQLDEQQLDKTSHPLYRVMLTGYKQIQPFFCLYQSPDGPKPFVFKALRVLTPQGLAIGYIVQLREAQRHLDLKEMNKSFVSLAAHQLKTPAGVVQGFLEMAMENKGKTEDNLAEIQRYLFAAYEANRSLIRIAKDLLNATKLTGGLVELQLAPFDLTEKVRLKLSGYRQWLFSKRVRFQVGYAMGGQPIVVSDSSIVSELFDILLHNAIKYVPKEGTINLRLNRHGNQVELLISDNGPGFHKTLDKAADQAAGEAAKISGSGLGLHLAKQFAALIKGDLSYEAIEPTGTQAKLRFPDLK